MKSVSELGLLALTVGAIWGDAVFAQAPMAAPTPTAAPAVSAPASPAPSVPIGSGVATVKLTETPVATVLKLSADNPFGLAAEASATLPQKPLFSEFAIQAPLFGALRVDRAGKVTQSTRVRDPIPSLMTDTKKSFDRWVFDPGRKSAQAVETWASVRVDLTIEIRPPKIEQIALTAVTPATPLPAPLEWGQDAAWYDGLKVSAPSDGTVAVELVDTPAAPKKTPWYADSFKGPFSCKLWVKVNAAGRIEKVIPIQISDPVLIAYFRHELPTWALKPARVAGQPAAAWHELAMSGTVGYSVEVRQIQNLRKTLAGG